MTARRIERTQCAGVTQQARQCRKLASRFYVDADGTVLRALCADHANGAGAMRYLRPFPWTYARVVDRNGHTVAL